MAEEQDSVMAVEACFATLERAAAAGVRCPMNGVGSVATIYVDSLAIAGRIKVVMYPRNYRVVTILTGPHAGKSTATPTRGKPWRITDTKGTRTNRMASHPGRRPAPGPVSAPRLLTREEIDQA